MSRLTREINQITGTIIGVSWKLILYAAVLLLLYEGVTRGYAFGHEIFYSVPMEAEPGTDKTFMIALGQSKLEITKALEKEGLIDNAYAALVQIYFYDYEMEPGTYQLNTSMNSKDILREIDDTVAQNKEEAKAEARVESQAAAVAETQTETQTETEIETQAETQAEVQPETQAETQVEIQIETQAEIQIEPEVVIQ